MKINKFGAVTLTEGPVKIEGWNIEREPDDPKDATDEQLLLGFAIHWAHEKLREATKQAAFDVFRKEAKKRADASFLPSITQGPRN